MLAHLRSLHHLHAVARQTRPPSCRFFARRPRVRSPAQQMADVVLPEVVETKGVPARSLALCTAVSTKCTSAQKQICFSCQTLLLCLPYSAQTLATMFSTVIEAYARTTGSLDEQSPPSSKFPARMTRLCLPICLCSLSCKPHECAAKVAALSPCAVEQHCVCARSTALHAQQALYAYPCDLRTPKRAGAQRGAAALVVAQFPLRLAGTSVAVPFGLKVLQRVLHPSQPSAECPPAQCALQVFSHIFQTWSCGCAAAAGRHRARPLPVADNFKGRRCQLWVWAGLGRGAASARRGAGAPVHAQARAGARGAAAADCGRGVPAAGGRLVRGGHARCAFRKGGHHRNGICERAVCVPQRRGSRYRCVHDARLPMVLVLHTVCFFPSTFVLTRVTCT